MRHLSLNLGRTPLVSKIAFRTTIKVSNSRAIVLLDLVSSADYLCKQVEPRSGPTKSVSKLFDTLMVFPK